MATLHRSNIGYVRGGDERPYGWNPGGFGCSNGCEECWARSMGKRFGATYGCDDCAHFRVHLHKERLCQPAETKAAGDVLVNFTCDTFDKDRRWQETLDIVNAAHRAPQHRYILLTKQPGKMGQLVSEWRREHPEDWQGDAPRSWYWGLTIRDQADADQKLWNFLAVPGKKWISYEPAWGGANFDPKGLCGEIRQYAWEDLCGIILGHDNRKGAPGTDTLEHIRSTIEQCKAAGVNWWVKQVWLDGKLLHASRPEQYARFPEDLKGGRLPWAKET